MKISLPLIASTVLVFNSTLVGLAEAQEAECPQLAAAQKDVRCRFEEGGGLMPCVGTPEDDTIRCIVEPDDVEGCTICGGGGDDMIGGSALDDSIYGENGDDMINGNEGNDFIAGGQGEDFINGGPGDDDIWGGEQDDRLSGSYGGDTLCGGGGKDAMQGGPGNDMVDGGDQRDKMSGGPGGDVCFADQNGDRTRMCVRNPPEEESPCI